jgi:hypothetical protein
MAKKVFISFDFDHDEDLRNLLVGQSRHPSTPFEIQDWSVKEPMIGNWRDKVRQRIRRIDLAIVICGRYTHTASGVSAELAIVREEGKPYFLLAGRSGAACTKPASAQPWDKVYNWTWDNLRALIDGAR